MSQKSPADPLKEFLAFQQRLSRLLRRNHAVAVGLAATRLIEAAASLETRVATSTFKVLVLGGMKRGKSTVINAMLGERVLPAMARPCTAVLSEVKFAEQRHAMLHPGDGGPPLEIPVERLAEHIAIRDETRANPYRLAEVYWPLDLCRDGVEIVDSPGLNDDAIREQVAGGYLTQADAIVYVLSARPPLAESERRHLERHLLPLGRENIFFLVNWIDEVAENERADLMADVAGRLSRIVRDDPHSSQPASRRQRVFFINASGALEGRLAQNAAQVEASGLPKFETALRRFLTQEKGRVRLMAPIRELLRRLAESRELIRERDHLYDQDLQDLIERYEAARPRLEALEHRRRIIVAGLDREIRMIESAVEEAARGFLGTLPARCQGWAAALETERRVSRWPWEAQRQADQIAAEVMTALDDHLQDEARGWQSSVFGPLLDERLAAIRDRLHRDVSAFLDHVRAIRLAIAGASPVSTEAADCDAVDRALAGAAGQPLASAMLGAGVSPKRARMTGPEASIKRQAGQVMADQLARSVPDQARTFARQVGGCLRALSRQVDQRLSAQIEAVREQVDTTIQAKMAGEDEVARRREQLRRLMTEIDLIEQERGDLADRIMAG